ncbi:hypothetical protein [Gemmiger formicilis]|uniref:hypothetical protein n=1 Tax=Gemmiger formicilis TaxID=745368 RepID=UPI00352176A8
MPRPCRAVPVLLGDRQCVSTDGTAGLGGARWQPAGAWSAAIPGENLGGAGGFACGIQQPRRVPGREARVDHGRRLRCRSRRRCSRRCWPPMPPTATGSAAGCPAGHWPRTAPTSR